MTKTFCKATVTLALAAVMTLMLVIPAGASTKTFEDYVPYSLKTFLSGYNLIAFEDVEMDIHCMGGVIIGGDFTTGDWIGFADGSNLPPSFIGGYAKGPVYNSRNAVNNAPLYVGPSNSVVVEHDQYKLNGKATGNGGKTPVYKNANFINMEAVWNTIVSTAELLRQQCSANPITLSGGNADIYFGSAVTIRANEIPKWVSTHGNIYFKGNSSQKVNTIITIEGSGTVKMPTVWVNGSQVNATEVGTDGTSIIWYLPDATRVDLGSAPWLGHIIAPNALITMPSGNYNGCLIGRNIDIGSEGHLYNYNANALPEPDPDIHVTPTPTPKPTATPTPKPGTDATPTPKPTATPTPHELKSFPLHLMVHKNVVKTDMPQNMPWSFTFTLTPVTANAPLPAGSKGGVATATVTSNDPTYLGGGAARFDAITYTSAGRYVYTLREVNDEDDYFSWDDSVYTITVDVTEHSGHQLVAVASYSKEGKAVSHLEYTNSFLHHEWRSDEIPLKGSIQLTKIDADTRKPLAGSVFGVYSDPNCEKLYALMPATDANGLSVLHGLAAGTYYLREKNPVEGYGINHTIFPVVVRMGETSIANDNRPIENIPGTSTVTLTKTVENAVTSDDFPFVIVLSGKKTGNVYITHDGERCFACSHDLAHDGQALIYLRHGDKLDIHALPTGTQVHISEISTGDAYEAHVNGRKGSDFTAVMSANSHETASFVNVVTLETPSQSQIDDMPDTGDRQNLALWCLLCAACITTLALVRRRYC